MEPRRRSFFLIIIVAVIILVGIVFVISKRGGSTKQATNQPTTLVYWGLWEPEEVMQEVIADYEKLNPNIKIAYKRKSFQHKDVDVTFSGVYFTSLLDRLKTADSVDIFRVHNSWIPMLKYYLSPLPTNIMSQKEYKKEFYPVAYEDFYDPESKQIYALPLMIDGLSLFYNKSLFSKVGIQSPPANWEQVVLASEKLRKFSADGEIESGGIGLGTMSNSSHGFEILMMMFTQANVPVLDNANYEITFDTSRGAEVVNYFLSFAGEQKVWSYRLRDDFSTFHEGKLGMMIAPSWRAFDIRHANQKLNFGIAKLPVLPGANADTFQYYATYWGEAVSKNSRNPVEAWKFIKYLSEPAQLKKIYVTASKGRDFGEIYSRKSMANELRDSPLVGPIIQMAPTMKSWQYGNILEWETDWREAIIAIESKKEPRVSVSDLLSIKEKIQKERDLYKAKIKKEFRSK